MRSYCETRFRRASRGNFAFTLIEIVLAIGLISFAIIGILGLFPVAMSAAHKSQEETHAALIARGIFAKIEAERQLDPTTRTIKTGTALTFDESGIATNSQVSGLSSGKAIYTAEITIQQNIPIAGLDQVEVDVKSATDTYPFVTLFHTN